MQKITFHNNQNDLEFSFATDTPRALLSAFDGNSLGAEFVQYTPIDFDGAKTLSHTLNARTITITADWYAVEGGKYSRSKALAEWEKMQWAFAIGSVGTLTWTNGAETRTIDCYANETPALHEKARGLFSADFTLTADYPLWQGGVLHSTAISVSDTSHFGFTEAEIENTCPISVPPLIKIEGNDVWIYRSGNTDKYRMMEIDTSLCSVNMGAIYVDNAQRYVYQYKSDGSGEKVNRNYSLTARSEFFSLCPGKNKIVLETFGADIVEATVTFSWRDHYLGVSI